jgi:hypothetical protein
MDAFKVVHSATQKSVSKPPPFHRAVSEVGNIKGISITGFEILNISRLDHQRLTVFHGRAQRNDPIGATKLLRGFHGKSPISTT